MSLGYYEKKKWIFGTKRQLKRNEKDINKTLQWQKSVKGDRNLNVNKLYTHTHTNSVNGGNRNFKRNSQHLQKNYCRHSEMEYVFIFSFENWYLSMRTNMKIKQQRKRKNTHKFLNKHKNIIIIIDGGIVVVYKYSIPAFLFICFEWNKERNSSLVFDISLFFNS